MQNSIQIQRLPRQFRQPMVVVFYPDLQGRIEPRQHILANLSKRGLDRVEGLAWAGDAAGAGGDTETSDAGRSGASTRQALGRVLQPTPRSTTLDG